MSRFNKDALVTNLKQSVAVLDQIMRSDTPLDMGRLKAVIGKFARLIGENKWNSADKYDINQNFQNLLTFIQAEKETVETTETDELQTNCTTEDGGEITAAADACEGEDCVGLTLEAGSDQTSTAEANIDASELADSDVCTKMNQ